MTVKDVGYPIGVTVDTLSGLISGRPLSDAVVVDLTGLTLDHTFADVPTWSPTVLQLNYLGYGLVYPGYHQWEYRVDNGNDVRACILTFSPTTGDTSIQALTKPSNNTATSWYSWSRTNLNPFGLYTTPFTTSGVIGSSVAPATVSAEACRTIPFSPYRWLGFWTFDGNSTASRVTGRPSLTQTSPWVGVLAPVVGGRIEITAGSWNERCAAFASSVTHAVAAARVSKTNNVIVRLSNSLNDATTYCLASLDIQSTSGAVKLTVNRYDLGGSDTWDGVVSGGDSVHIALEVRSDRRITVWLEGVMHDTGVLWPAGVSVGSVQFVGRNVGGPALLDDCCAFSGPATPALIEALRSGRVPAADGSFLLPASAGFNNARWVGAWDMEGTSRPNIVSGAPGGLFNVSGYTGYVMGNVVPGGPAGSTKCIELPSTAGVSYGYGAQVPSQPILTAFTMSAWLKGDAAGHAPNLRIFRAINDSSGSVNLTVGLNNVYIGGWSYTVPVEPVDTNWHHYALTWNGLTGATKAYVDGVEVWSGTTFVGTVQCGWCGFDAATVELNGFGDDFALHRDVLPADAIARLAEGHLPAADGRLPDAPMQVSISASNASGVDTKTLVLTAAEAYRYWRIEITDPGVAGSFGGLVVNEIEGYESDDGSGTNVFRDSAGTVCTSTGGYMGSPGYTGDGAASVAIDGNTADSASGTYTATGNVVGQYFQFDCGVPRSIRLSKVFFTSGTWQVGVKLRASQDGTNWTDRSAQVVVGAGARPTLVAAL